MRVYCINVPIITKKPPVHVVLYVHVMFVARTPANRRDDGVRRRLSYFTVDWLHSLRVSSCRRVQIESGQLGSIDCWWSLSFQSVGRSVGEILSRLQCTVLNAVALPASVDHLLLLFHCPIHWLLSCLLASATVTVDYLAVRACWDSCYIDISRYALVGYDCVIITE